MTSGAPFQAGVPIPAAELNRKTITQTTNLGNEVKLPGQIFYNMDDNGGFQKDDVVAWNADADGYNVLSMKKHSHDADSHEAGGTLKTIFEKNLLNFLYFSKRIGISVNDFMSMGSGGSTALDHATGAIKMDTGSSSNNYRNLHLMGIPLSFTEHSIAQTNMQFTGAVTNQFCRWGVGMEALNLTNDADEKYGIESCAATNGNWFVVSANGSTRSQQDSLKPLLGGGEEKSYIIENVVGVSIDFTYDDDAAVSKATNLPTSGDVVNNNILNYGVKTSNTSAKQLYVWGVTIVGDSGSD